MEIKTKYNIGDEFWIMQDNRPISCNVDFIHINVYKFPADQFHEFMYTDIAYEDKFRNRIQVKETDFYPSKEALLKSL